MGNVHTKAPRSWRTTVGTVSGLLHVRSRCRVASQRCTPSHKHTHCNVLLLRAGLKVIRMNCTDEIANTCGSSAFGRQQKWPWTSLRQPWTREIIPTHGNACLKGVPTHGSVRKPWAYSRHVGRDHSDMFSQWQMIRCNKWCRSEPVSL